MKRKTRKKAKDNGLLHSLRSKLIGGSWAAVIVVILYFIVRFISATNAAESAAEAAAISRGQLVQVVLPEGMSAAEAEKNITVEAGTGLEAPEISVRETESGAELYCEAGFTPGTSFTLYAKNGVQFAGYPEYIDTLTVSVFREQVEVVEADLSAPKPAGKKGGFSLPGMGK